MKSHWGSSHQLILSGCIEFWSSFYCLSKESSMTVWWKVSQTYMGAKRSGWWSAPVQTFEQNIKMRSTKQGWSQNTNKTWPPRGKWLIYTSAIWVGNLWAIQFVLLGQEFAQEFNFCIHWGNDFAAGRTGMKRRRFESLSSTCKFETFSNEGKSVEMISFIFASCKNVTKEEKNSRKSKTAQENSENTECILEDRWTENTQNNNTRKHVPTISSQLIFRLENFSAINICTFSWVMPFET